MEVEDLVLEPMPNGLVNYGVTNNGTTNGTVSWTPTQAGTFYYICSLHGGMVGTITVN